MPRIPGPWENLGAFSPNDSVDSTVDWIATDRSPSPTAATASRLSQVNNPVLLARMAYHSTRHPNPAW
jgi:hypothetical protein